MRIAAFDSGVGGLSALAPLFARFPSLDVTYLGDLANLPYGTKSPRRVAELTARNVEWLLDKGVVRRPDHFVLACNTASSHALEEVRGICGAHGVDFTNVLGPACREALAQNPSRVVVLATSSTVNSGSYERALRELGFTGPVASRACPLFVPLVEDALTEGPAVEAIARRYLDPLALAPDDAVILGCTHYPYLLKSLRGIYPKPRWVEAGDALLSEPAFAARGEKKAGAKARLRMLFTDTTATYEGISRFLNSLGVRDVEFELESVPPLA